MRNPRYLVPLCILLSMSAWTRFAFAQDVTVPLGESTERHLLEPFAERVKNSDAIRTLSGDKLEVRSVTTEEAHTVKMKNVVPPIHFESGVAKIPPGYVEKISR